LKELNSSGTGKGEGIKIDKRKCRGQVVKRRAQGGGGSKLISKKGISKKEGYRGIHRVCKHNFNIGNRPFDSVQSDNNVEFIC